MRQKTVDHPRTEPTADPLENLSDNDRLLFHAFGWGESRPVPHTLVHHAFEHHAAAAPDAIAAEHRGERITYGELNRRADRLARILAGYGVRRGDRVGLFLRRGIPMLTGILGTLKAGAGYVPQDVRIATEPQLRHIIATAGTRVILTLSDLADRIPAPEGHTCLTLDTLPDPPAGPAPEEDFPPPEPGRAEDTCYVLFTSGTTGNPNGVRITHGNVCNILLGEPGGLGIRPGWRVAQLLNIAFDMAAWEILGCLSHGGTLVIRDEDLADTVREVEVVIATPTVLGSIDPASARRIRRVAVAGEPCPRPLADRWARLCTFHNACGPTETTIVNTMQRHEPGALRLTIGRPTPNNTVYVLDEHRRPCPIGETGEMWAGGAGVSAGYLDNPRLNAERYAPDPFLPGNRLMFRTRDLGRWTPDGELEHLGRTDDQVKVRGFRVELDSVSAALEVVPGCTRAATIKLDDRTLVSFVQPTAVDPVEAAAAVAAALPYYCVPARVYPLPALPSTSRGKIDKAALLRIARTEGIAA
ncbi:amino acid adenylation domain-containing protein [Amycolatopsis cihanbeyliensis]|uniref:Amino acid adenylation domain-containing protein n=1 Tax=Amycolatopsis cihanbeyliensis TaxID=1128664 RepID=A0A542CSH3_AMYCI|nr:amino acid adenylation domain-containing protein [Amycolatopsis cihanbeyliensis]TQI93730.1 amino acid adenylation domain-containing protein [Amycolatopsis cihanbeyliensis]